MRFLFFLSGSARDSNTKKRFWVIAAAGLFLYALVPHVPLSAQSSPAAEAVLRQVAERLSQFQFDEAVALFDTIPLPERDSTRIKLLKASVLNSAGRRAEARAIVEPIVAAENRNVEALLVLSAIEGALGRAAQQQTLLERITAIDPDNTEALLTLGEIHLRTRSLRPAAASFHRVFTLQPENIDALLGLGRVFRLDREWGQAELFFNRALQLYPHNAEAWAERGRLYRFRGFLVNALDDFDEAKKLAPRDYWIAIDRANLLLEMNRKREALEEFNRAVSINPNESQAYIYSAGLKDDLGDLDGAERDYEMLARLKPDYFFGLEGLGFHRMRKGAWEAARNAFTEAYRRAPDSYTDKHYYALLAAINWMRLDIAAPRQLISQVMNTRVQRDTLEWHMFRLYFDLSGRSYSGEADMARRLDREPDSDIKARMLFYMALYYDVRGSPNLANRYYVMVDDLGARAFPEWRFNEWIVASRNLRRGR